MRVYMVLTALAPIGGIETSLVSLCQGLRDLGHEVVVYALEAPPVPNQNVEALTAAGVRIVSPNPLALGLTSMLMEARPGLAEGLARLATLALLPIAVIDALVRRRSLHRSATGLLGTLRGALARHLDFRSSFYTRLEREFALYPPDLVHVHGWGCGEDPPFALNWLRAKGLPVLYTEHNSPDPALHPVLEDAAINMANLLIAVSEAGADGLRKVGLAQPPIRVIPYSIEPLPDMSRVDSSGPIVALLCVARLAPQKGHHYLLQAMSALAAEGQPAQLMIAGDGPLRNSLEAEARRLGVDTCTRFLGQLNRQELIEALRAADIVVLPSLWEGLPVALIEAMSAGKPIVATGVGGNVELAVHGDNGLIVPPSDVEALRAAMRTLIVDGALRGRMARASRERFDKAGFTKSAVANRTVEAYCLAIQLASA